MDFKINKSDLYVLLLYFAIAIPINCFDYADYDDKMDLVVENLLMVFFDTTCILVIVFYLFPKFFPKKQFVLLLVCSLGFLMLWGLLFINVVCFIGNCTGKSPMSMAGMYRGLMLITESFTIPGLFIMGKKLYEAQTNFLKMEKEKKESELLRLNAQIDPHFLFNNLNTIDSLIDTNPSGAKIYLNKLSRLYRYLIATKDQEVVELDEELQFAQNYIYLIQSRFGNAYQFEIQQNNPNQDISFIPPGALQTLLENIVKHNQPSPSVPINCQISITDDTIEVRNNLNRGVKEIDSTGTGLTNLRARYKLLIDQEISISTNGDFTVILPLIKEVD